MNTLKIDKVDRKSLSEQVEEQLRDAIRDMGLKPGDALPGEIDLAERFGVSRNVVREALVRLKAVGVLDSRKNRGIVLCEPDWVSNMSDIMDLPVWNDDSWRELAEIRVMLELGMAELIYRRKTPEEVQRLDDIVSREEADPSNQELGTECDFEFHVTLYRITGNHTLLRFQSLLRKSLDKSHAHTFFPDRFSNPERVNHRIVLESLKNDSLTDFLHTMYRHFGGVLEHMEHLYRQSEPGAAEA